jgi:signal peptidase I
MISFIRSVRHWYDQQHSWIRTTIVLIIIFIIRTIGFGLYQVPTGSMETTMLVGERFFADKFTVWVMPLERGEIISFNDPNFPYSENSFYNAFQRYVWGPSNWTKRIIGLPGERVTGKVVDGKPVVFVNGVELQEPYLNHYPLVVCLGTRPRFMFDLIGETTRVPKSYDPAIPFGNQQPFYRILPTEVIGYPDHMDIRKPFTPAPQGIDIFDVTLGENEYWVMGDNRQGSYDSRMWGPLDGKLIHGKIKFRMLSVDLQNPWMIVDLITHPIDFWSRIRYSRCFQFVS